MADGSEAEGRRQIHRIRRQQQQIQARRALLEKIIERRRGRDVLQFRVDEIQGPDVLFVDSELLIRSSDLSNRRVQDVLTRDGMQAETIEGLDNRVARVRPERGSKDPRELKQALDDLEAAGADASLSLVTPNQIILKSEATPEYAHHHPGPRPPQSDTGATDKRAPKVRVAILDTGICRSERTDGWLRDIHEDADNRDPRWAYSEQGILDFAAGHGTFIAGIYQQIAPDADVRVYRVLDTDGIVGEVEVACGIVERVQSIATERERPDRLILNLSLGSDTVKDDAPLALQAAMQIVREVERDREMEILVVASAGNSGGDQKYWPAAFAETDHKVVAVSSLDDDRKHSPSEWATRGDWVTCSIQGESVVSTFVEGRENPDLDPLWEEFHTNAWASWTGTSFAAPQVGALVAAHVVQQDHHDVSLSQALDIVLAEYRVREHPDPKYGVILRSPLTSAEPPTT